MSGMNATAATAASGAVTGAVRCERLRSLLIELREKTTALERDYGGAARQQLEEEELRLVRQAQNERAEARRHQEDPSEESEFLFFEVWPPPHLSSPQ